MLVTLPFVLLLLDAWPLRRPARVGWARLVAEKVPMFAAAAAISVVTLAAQVASRNLEITLGARLSNAAVAYVTYLWRTAWPLHLAIFYPRREPEVLLGVACAAVLGLLAFVAIVQRERRPWVLVGLSWFFGMLVPTIGLVTVGDQASADRYTYLPSLGLFVTVVWTLADPAAQGSKRWQRAIPSAAALILVLSATLAWRQIGFFRTNLALWQRAYEVGGESPLVEWSLSAANLVETHDPYAVAKHCRNAVRLAPDVFATLKTCGERFAMVGLDAEAIDALRAAMRLSPDDAIASFELASVLARRGELEEAERLLARAVELAPNVREPREALAAVRRALRNRMGTARPPVAAPR
jgi:protein O-mannosyl-transferase